MKCRRCGMPMDQQTKTMKQWVYYSDISSIDLCIFCAPL